jgi:hypothetical protein
VHALLLALVLVQSPPPEGPPPPPAPPLPVVAPVDAGTPGPTLPPVFSSDVPVEVAPEPPPRPAPQPEPERTTILHFSPVSLFATHLSFELEKAVSDSVTVFGAIGGSLVLQAGLDLGLRVYVSHRALEGAFLDVQGSVFYFSSVQTLLVGPGALFGYVFRPRGSFALSVGAGLQVWYQPTMDQGMTVLGVQPQSPVIFLPGFQRPGTGNWGPQPILRLTVGPAF